MAATIEGVTAEGLADFDPARYDAVPRPDGTFDLVPLLWWDDASYARWQGDVEDDYRGSEAFDDDPHPAPEGYYAAPSDGYAPGVGADALPF